MAQLNKAAYEAKYNDAGTGIFKTGQSRGIGSEDTRALVEDNADSAMFLDDNFIDEDSMASNSATKAPSQQSVKAYVDAQVASGATSVSFGSTTGTNTYAITATPTVTAYADGDLFLVKVVLGSTGASTLNFNGVGAKKVYDHPDKQISVGDFEDNRFYLVSYDAALDAAVGGFIVLGDLNHERVTIRNAHDASSNLFPTTGGTGPGGAVKTGDAFTISVAGTLGTDVVANRDLIIALADTPGQTAGNWTILAGLTATDNKLALKAPLASPTLTGTPTAPTASVDTDTTQIANTEFVQEQKKIQTVSVTGTTYTLLLTDAFKKLEVDNADAVTVTVPLASSVDFEVGTMVAVNWYGVCGGALAGVTIAATGGVTINSSSTGLTIQSRYSTVVLEKVATNEWNLYNGTPPTLLPIVVSIALTTTNETFTNHANSQLATAAIGAKYDLGNFRQIKLSARVGTASASANTPRLYLLYSTNDGGAYSILGQGTVASGEAISLAATGYPETDWYDIPVGAKTVVVIRSAVNGGDGTADPTIGSQYVHLKQ